MGTVAAALAATLLAVAPVAGAADSLDPAFSTDGIVTTPFGATGVDDAGMAIVRQDDGKLVVAGNSGAGLVTGGGGDFAVARYNDDGSLDTGFDGDGKVVTSFIADPDDGDEATAVAIAPDDKIVVAGLAQTTPTTTDFAVARYNTDGTLDTTFDGDGKVTVDFGAGNNLAYGVAVQDDEKVVVVGRDGNLDWGIARLNEDGSLDTGFDGDGKFSTVLNGSGSEEAYDVAIQPADDKIVVAGEASPGFFDQDFGVIRLNPGDGSLDTSFSGDGKVTTAISSNASSPIDTARGIAIQDDGKLVAAGETFPFAFAVVRYNTDGSLDPSFDGDGVVTTNASSEGNASHGYDVAIAPDDKIVAAGVDDPCAFDCSFTVVRYHTNGSIDTGFDADGKGIAKVATGPTEHDEARGVLVQPDGKIVAGGLADMGTSSFDLDFAVVRFRENGDNTPPAVSVTDTDPDSPSNDNEPEIKGTAEAGSTVKLYTTAGCTGSPVETGTAAEFASPGITHFVLSNTTTTFRATATDEAGNTSACSATSVTYVEDSNAPTGTAPNDTDPNSPADDNSPEIKGTAEAGSTVKLYTGSDCSGSPVATGTAADFASPGFTVSVPNDSSTTFRATATDAAGNTSTCSALSITYVEDSTAPAAPSITDSDPDSPSNDNNPEFKGTAEAGSTVKLYTTSDCSGTAAATGTAAAFASPGLTANVPSDATTDIRATATDAAGHTSTCSSAFAYTEDSTGPDAPTITDTDPDSPANDNNPEVKGTVGGGSPTQVRVFANATCSSTPAATGTVAQFTGSGITIAVSDNTTTTLSAQTRDAAGNNSACSSTITYVEDSAPPAAPTLTDTDPNSPASDNSPEVKGTAAANSTVFLYTTSDCTGTPAAVGSASDFASPGLTVSVGDNSSTTFRATAMDTSGNTSACSTSTITYVEDSTAPDAPTITDTDPDSPSNDNSPEVKGTVGSGSPTQVLLYKTSDCSGAQAASGTVAAFTGSGITVAVTSDTTTALSARAADAAGNQSGCSNTIDYVEDSTAPAAPSIIDSDPDSPANDNAPEIKGSAEAGSTVRLYKSSSCLGGVAGQGSATDFTSPGLTISVLNDSSTTLTATATDAAGNISSCSSTFSYVEDSTAPPAPSITDTDPNSPANDNNPEVKGTVSGSPTNVRVFDNGSCGGDPSVSSVVGTAATFTGTGITVSVQGDTTTNFSARSIDSAGNESTCSASFAYTEDSTAPSAPTVSDTDPDSPANDNSPEVKGTAEAGSTVKLFTTSDCSGSPTATGTATSFNGSGISASVSNDSTTTFRATATDAAGNASGCSSTSVTYVEDSTGPALPTLTDTDPDSPANENNPEVKGTAEAGSTVALYTNSVCLGTPAASGTAADFATPGFTVTVTDNSTTTYYAKATDASGNASGCSTSSITYVEDSTAPDPPSITDTDPNSPANDNNPEVKGTAFSGSQVKIYKNGDCSGSPAATGTVAAFTGSGITVNVTGDATTTLTARATDSAGNDSACSGTFSYVEDSTAPAAPTITDTDPNSPANDNSPRVMGTAETNSTVTLYQSNDCSGPVEAQGAWAEFDPAGGAAQPGLVASVPDDQTQQFTVTAADAAGNVSPCSNAFSYTEDSTAPSLPTLTDTDPDSPGNDNNPEVKGTAEAGSTVKLYTNSSCTSSVAAEGSAAAFTSPGLTTTVTNNTTTTYRAKATDAAGNVSGCSTSSIAYTEDSTAPNAPTFTDTDPDSPANDNEPEVEGSAEAGSTVTLFTTSDCSGTVAATGSAASFSSPGLTAAVPNDSTTTFKARATDAAGNVSACSPTSIDYVEDSTAPAGPTFTDTDPDSPANDTAPEVKGTAEVGSTVKLYTTGDCSGTAAATGTSGSFASPGLTVTVTNDSSTTLRATATDAAGNTSDCSTGSITYVEDSTAPDAPTITDTDPDSPANDNNPEVKGTTGSGSPSQVKLYKNGSCSGSPAATGTVASFTGSGITVSVTGDTTTTLTARTTDQAGNDSACSGTFSYTEDSTAPTLPTLSDTDPNSPANDNNPEVKGSAEAGSTVKLYTNSDCTSAVAAEGSATSFASPGLTATVADDSSITFRATTTDAAGNTSGCSTSSIAYTEDSTAPAAATLTDTDPDSPANDNNPEIKGTAAAGSTVKLFTSSDCSGSPAATGTATSFNGSGIGVTVADDSSTTFRATATDSAGNASACSTSSIAYTEDSTAPAAPTLSDTDPDSPANDNNPEVKGTAEAGATVQLYDDPFCSGEASASGSAASLAAPGLTASVFDDTTTTFRATATDAAGNESGCSTSSIAYAEDSTPPDTEVDSGPSGPTTDTTPTFEFSAPGESGATFQCRFDSAAFAACTSPHTPAALGDGPHSFDVRAVDQAGNSDSSAATRAFSVDTDSDDDGVTDSSDTCPNVPAQTANGCPTGSGPGPGPPSDGDGDGVPDASDACPTQPAQTANGCPTPGPGPGPQPGPTDGDDTLTGDGLANTICGLLGDDEIEGAGGNDTLFGDACNDTAKSLFGAQAGTDGDDTLSGSDGNDRLYGAGGRDTLRGGNGNDRLFGGAGNDVLSGGAGTDTLDGGTGDDRLTGGTGTNRYAGGSGTDVVSARNGRKERVDCGSGRKDRATVDRTDKVRGCEKVKRPRR